MGDGASRKYNLKEGGALEHIFINWICGVFHFTLPFNLAYYQDVSDKFSLERKCFLNSS